MPTESDSNLDKVDIIVKDKDSGKLIYVAYDVTPVDYFEDKNDNTEGDLMDKITKCINYYYLFKNFDGSETEIVLNNTYLVYTYNIQEEDVDIFAGTFSNLDEDKNLLTLKTKDGKVNIPIQYIIFIK